MLAGIGHEIDHSITDFTADFSAATPSHTAQLLWQERRVFEQYVDSLEVALEQAVEHRLENLASQLNHSSRSLSLLSPQEKLRLQEEKLASSRQRMDAALEARLSLSGRLLEQLSLRLGNAGEHRLRLAEQAAERATAPLEQLGKMVGLRQEHELSRLELRLNALDPYEPLKRGYAMALNEDGTFLRSVDQTAPGKRVTVELADGRLVTIVDAVEHGDKGADA